MGGKKNCLSKYQVEITTYGDFYLGRYSSSVEKCYLKNSTGKKNLEGGRLYGETRRKDENHFVEIVLLDAATTCRGISCELRARPCNQVQSEKDKTCTGTPGIHVEIFVPRKRQVVQPEKLLPRTCWYTSYNNASMACQHYLRGTIVNRDHILSVKLGKYVYSFFGAP